MTKEEFELMWRTNAGFSIEQYNYERITEKCDCGEEGCHGWGAMPKRFIDLGRSE